MGTGLVGSIVGEVSALPTGSGSSLTDTGLGYDVAIGGLGFKLKISDDSPYERATAQFKKDQFDSSQNYGDQSLLGYWTLGQFSFHKGAGLKYYDANDATLANRYKESVGVDPFTTLGETSLRREWISSTSTALTSPNWIGGGADWVGIKDGSTFKYTQTLGAALTTFTPSAGTATAVAPSPASAYVSTSSSKVERQVIGGAATVLYTGALFNYLFYGKDRLWGWQNSDKTWYQLSPDPAAPPVAVAAGDKVFTVRDPDAQGVWAFADTPGPVLFGNGPRIFAVTVDNAGAVPSLSGPVQVAELPPGETIYSMKYHLGFLVLNTRAGIRVAVVSADGQVTYGPLLIDFGGTGTAGFEMGVKGSSVYVAVALAPAAPPVIYQVNLAQQIGDTLEFAIAKTAARYTYTIGLMGVGNFGATLVSYGRDGAATVADLKHEGANFAASGSLTTGFLRYGTLDPKQFQTVRVRFGGTGGTITVYRVMSDGSEISLYTIDVLTSSADEITLGLSSPLELIGLKFELTRMAADASRGPTLLGYQLRALPAPKRQRLIRLPLMLMDVERRGTTRATGYEGSAWDRLSALEDMEQSGGVFQFQDFRTGEAGTVYIESIEHQGKTPPGKQDTGFGGVVFATLRKL